MRNARKALEMKTAKSITISKLIEYAFATPQRRTLIIENAINPPAFIVDTKYPEIERATAQFIVSRGQDTSRLDNIERQLQTIPLGTEHQETRLLNAFEALDRSRQFKWEFPENFSLQEAGDLPQDFPIADLNVRVRPNVLLMRNKTGSKYPEIGVVKPYLSKTFPLQNKNRKQEAGVLYGSLLHWYAEEMLTQIGDATFQLCIVGDIFSEIAFQAAPHFNQRRKKIKAIAQEISDRWDPISTRLKMKNDDAKVKIENIVA